MDGNNNWRASQGDPSVDGSDWRKQLLPESRQRIVNKIMETLKKHLPISGPDGLVELKKIALRFEDKIYNAATSQPDYLRKISLKMLTMETKTQSGGNSLPANSGGNQNPSDPASQSLQNQVRNPSQSLSIPMGNHSQPRQQHLPQNLQNALTSASTQSSSLQSGLASVNGLPQTSLQNVVGQSSSLQNMTGIMQNTVNNSVGQGLQPIMFPNTQRPVQGRQHPQQVLSKQQQSQNSQQLYQQTLIHTKLQQGNMQSSLSQPQMPQQQSSILQSSQMQSSITQSASQSSLQQNHLQQNQQISVQQSGQSGIQQHQQSVLRQQQAQQSSMHQQSSAHHQQQTQVNQQQMLLSQQHLTALPSGTSMQQNQLLSQHNTAPDSMQQQQQQQQMFLAQNNFSSMQQQQLLSQQNKNLHQSQQLGLQTNVSGVQQQQQLIVSQSGQGISSMQHQHSLSSIQQPKVAPQQPQQSQQPSTLLPSQGQQSQSQPLQQQLMSQSQPAQLQQHLGLQQQPNTFQREMQQRIQSSSALHHSQTAIEQQKQLYPSQRPIHEASSTSMESTAQTGHMGTVDWREEVYQKLKSMKDSYLPDLNELYQKIAIKCQQNESLPPQSKINDQIAKFIQFKTMVERLIAFLQLPKSSITSGHKDKLHVCEKQIVGVLNSNKFKKPAISQQPGEQLQQPVGPSHTMAQPSQSQMPQLQQNDNLVNQMQPMSMQGSIASMQSSAVNSLHHGPMPLPTHMLTSSNLEQGQGIAMNSLPQGVIGSLPQSGIGLMQQNNANSSQQSNISGLPQNNLQQNVYSLQTSSNILQPQQLKQQQEQQLMQSQQLKSQPYSQRIQALQQQKQQLLQQQQPHLSQHLQQQQHLQSHPKQQPLQLHSQQISQLHQMNEMSDMKIRPGGSVKPGLLSHTHLAGQRSTSYQQLKTSASFPISSPQLLQAVSPQLSQQSSPQIDQQNLPSTLPKAGTPLQPANSPFNGTPSSPAVPSVVSGDLEKQPLAISSVSNGGNIGHLQSSHVVSQAQSLAIATPGMSASPLLAEVAGLDGNQGAAPTNIPGKMSGTEHPLERLMKAIRSVSPKTFSSAVSNIASVVSMVDRIAGSAPGNGSRAAVGEDLVAMTKCRLQARNFMSHDGNVTTKKMRRLTSAMPMNAVSSVGSMNDSLRQFGSFETSELESTATSRVKRSRSEANHALIEEVNQINQQLIDTVVEISDEDVDSIAAATEGEGTVVKCSYNAVALSPNFKSQYSSAQLSPISPLRLLVPSNYPICSPVLLDKLPIEPSKETEDLSVKAKTTFNMRLRGLQQPISLRDIAQTWEVCTRKVISDYAQQCGGGTFSSRYGIWESCVSA